MNAHAQLLVLHILKGEKEHLFKITQPSKGRPWQTERGDAGRGLGRTYSYILPAGELRVGITSARYVWSPCVSALEAGRKPEKKGSD